MSRLNRVEVDDVHLEVVRSGDTPVGAKRFEQDIAFSEVAVDNACVVKFL